MATVAGVIVAALALFVAWLQYASQATISAATSPVVAVQTNNLNLFNLSVVIAFFFAATFASSSLIRLLAHSHAFAAFALSIPTAVLSSFSSLVVLYLAPPKLMNAAIFATAIDAVFWGTLITYVALHGQSILQHLFEREPSKKSVSNEATSNNDSGNGAAILISIGLLLLFWSGLVSAGVSKLATMFLSQ